MLLGTAQHHHSAKLLRRDVTGERPANLLQRKAQVFQGKNSVQARQLLGRVIAVPGPWNYVRRLEQSCFIVEAERFDLNARKRRKLTDLEHESVVRPPVTESQAMF
jgi:hypothetical protein